jgi:5,10-methylenetetrahydromethanopterin reductase
MLSISVQIIPHLDAKALTAVAVEAERLGYANFWLSDEGFMTEPFVALGMIVAQTERIGLGVVTNPYTRHPAMTAAALATLDQMSSGRALLCYVAGGSLVLDPLNMARPQPVQTVEEAIHVTRELLKGEPVIWAGERFQLNGAQLEVRARHDIPIHVAGRGPRMLAMAARTADAVWVSANDPSQDIPALRAMAHGNPLRLIGGDHPPMASQLVGALGAAVQQDSMEGSAHQTQAANLDDWKDLMRHNAAEGLFDELLIVAWENELPATVSLLRQVKEMLS